MTRKDVNLNMKMTENVFPLLAQKALLLQKLQLKNGKNKN